MCTARSDRRRVGQGFVDTAEMLAVFKSWQGAMKVMDMIGSLAKPLGYIAALIAAVVGIWNAMKSGVSPK